MSRGLERCLKLFVLVWFAGILRLTFGPLPSTLGEGFGFWLIVLGILFAAPDVILPEKPKLHVILSFFLAMSGIAFVGYRAFAAAADHLAFKAGDILLLVIAFAVVYTLAAIRVFRPRAIGSTPPRDDERKIEGQHNKSKENLV
jgi:hypothetical protein